MSRLIFPLMVLIEIGGKETYQSLALQSSSNLSGLYSPKLAAIGENFLTLDTSQLAAGKFIEKGGY